MRYEWDERKNASNLEKHGVAFEAILEAAWDRALIAQDTRMDYAEVPFQAYVPIRHRLYVVVYVHRKNVRRIISLRKANPRERNRYEQTHF